MKLVYPRNDRVLVLALIQDDQDRVLFVLHNDGVLSLPGGFVAKGETTAEAMKRYLSDDLGISAKVRKVGESITGRSEARLIYRVESYAGQLPKADEQMISWADPFDSNLTNRVYSLDLNLARLTLESAQAGN